MSSICKHCDSEIHTNCPVVKTKITRGGIKFTKHFVDKVVGKKGPVVVNMNVCNHAFGHGLSEDDIRRIDTLVICPDDIITYEALHEILMKYRKSVKEYYYSGRSYFFEGMYEDEKGGWYVIWGS